MRNSMLGLRDDNFDKRFKKTKRIVVFQSIVVGLLCILLVILSIYLAWIAADKIRETDFSKGIKPIIEKTWCGKEGCFDK